MLIRPLQLGSLSFPHNLIQGPLAGVSCAPFRRLAWEYSQPAFSCTEMLSVKTLLYQPQLAQRRFLKKDPAEGPVCFQLAANDPQELAQATATVTALGADLIDLNCGCPVRKMRAKGMGSGLLSQPSQLYQLITAMKRHTHVPVSIKIRVEGGSQDKFNAEIVKVVQDAGVDYLIVHGRHWNEHYETPCDHDQIAYFVNELTIPVIGNGDVACLSSLKKMLATGCAGIMIGRAGVGQPWLIAQLMAEMRGETFIPPSSKEIANVFLQHMRELIELVGNERMAILQSRKLAKYYARGITQRLAFTQAVSCCESLQALEQLCENYF